MGSVAEERPFLFTLAPLLRGTFWGLVVALDPYLTNIVANSIDVQIRYRNIFKLFPYELTLLVLGLFLIVPLLIRLVMNMFVQTEKSFIVIFMIAASTTALHNVGSFDGADFTLIIFAFITMIKKMHLDAKFSLGLLDILNILLLACMFLSIINGGIISIVGMVLGIKAFLIVFLLSNLINRKDLVYFFVKWFVIIGTLSAVVGIAQEAFFLATGYPLVGNMEKNMLKRSFEETSLGTWLRVPAFTGSYKNLTSMLIPSLGIIFNLLLYDFSEKGLKTKCLFFASLTLMSIGLLLTFSNDSILAVILIILLSIVVRWQHKIIHFAAAGFICFAAGLIYGVMNPRLFESIYGKLVYTLTVDEPHIRIALASQGISGILHRNTWLGIGNKFGYKYTCHYFHWPPHNAFVNAGSEIGVIGLIPYIWIFVYVFFLAVLLKLNERERRDKIFSTGFLFGMLGLFISMQFHGIYINTFMWLLMGLLQAYSFIIVKERNA